MNRKKNLAKELSLKTELRHAIQANDDIKEERIRKELSLVRSDLTNATIKESYGALGY